MCKFCDVWDWGESSAEINCGKYAHIINTLGSYRFQVSEQFNFCPVCGCRNPGKGRNETNEKD